MSKSIDERVVRMEFDNKNFEANAKATMSTIDKLKEKLNFKGAAKGVSEIDNATKKINLNSLASGVENISSKFTTLGIVGVTALQDISRQVISTAKNLVDSLTVAPIMSGFREYETQIGAIQTILANTSSAGTTLEQVTAALDELNLYADKTIYNFTEMTRNIGTFTAAGVDLKTSVEAIKGIANLAAMSGSTSTQASTAMYQLSQALAAGRVSLQDWNSVVNAGMGGKVFQEALMRTAETMGIVVDRSVSFRESISARSGDSWLTSDVLLQTLRQFTGDMTDAELAAQGFNEAQIAAIQAQAKTANEAATQVKTLTQLLDTMNESVTSGWTQTWEIIIGDFGEARELFTDISDVFGEFVSNMSNARNDLLSGGLSSGWKQFMNEGISNQEDYLLSLEEAMNAYGYYEGFLDDLIETHGSFEESLKSGWMTTDLLADSVSRYATRLNSMSQEELEAAGYTSQHVQQVNQLNESIQNGTVDLDHFLKLMMRDSGRQNIIEGLRKAFESLLTILKPVKDAFGDVFEAMQPEELYQMTSNFRQFFTNLSNSLSKNTTLTNNLYRTFKGLFSIFDILGKLLNGALKTGFSLLGKAVDSVDEGVTGFTANIGDAISAFNEWLESSNLIDGVVDKFVSWVDSFDLVEKGLKELGKGFESLKKIASSGISGFKNWISEVLKLKQVQNLGGVFTNFADIARSSLNSLISNIQKAISEFKKFNQITPENVLNFFKDLVESVKDFIKGIGEGFDQMTGASDKFKAALDVIVSSTSEGFGKIKSVVQGFVDFFKNTFANFGVGEFLTVGFVVSLIYTMKQIRTAVSLFKDVVNTLQGPVGAFNTLLGSISGAINGFTSAMKTRMKAEAFKTIAEGIAILAASIAVLSLLDTDKLISAATILGLFAAGVAAVAKALKLFDAGPGADSLKVSALVLGISAAIAILVGSLKMLDSIKMDTMPAKLGVLGLIAVGLAAVVIAISRLGNLSGGLGGVSSALAILGVGGAIWLIVNSLQSIENVNFDKIKSNIDTLIGIFALLSLAAIAAGKVKFTNAVGLIALVLSFRMFINVLEGLSDVNFSAIEENLGAFIVILGSFATLLVASHFASKNATSVGTSMLLMSGSVLILIEAMKQMSKLSQSDIERTGAVITAMYAVFAGIMVLSKFSGANAAKAGVGILAMSAAIVVLSGAMFVMSNIKPEGLTRSTVAISVLIGMFALLQVASKYTTGSQGTIAVMAMSIAALAGIMAAMSLIDPESIKTNTLALSLLMAMFALVMKSAPIIQTANKSILVMTLAVAALGGVLVMMSGFNVQNAIPNAVGLSILLLAMVAALKIGAGINPGTAASVATGIATFVGIISALAVVVTAIAGLLAQIPGIDGFIADAQKVVTGIFGVLGSMVGGFIGGVASGAATVITNTLPSIAQGLNDFAVKIQPFLILVQNVSEKSVEGTKRLMDIVGSIAGGSILQGISNIFGGTSNFETFSEGLTSLATSVATFAEKIGTIDQTQLENAMTVVTSLASLSDAMPKEGGLFDWVTGGTMNFEDFGTQLESLATGINTFLENTKEMDTSNLDSSIDAIKKVAALGDSMPQMMGLIDLITGGQMDFQEFSRQLPLLAFGIQAYCFVIKGLDTSNLDVSLAAIRKIATLGSCMPQMVGLVDYIVGGQMDFEEFGDQIKELGEGIVDYCTSIQGLTTDNLDVSLAAIRKIATLGSCMPQMVGLVDYIVGGQMDFKQMGDQLTSLGGGIADYCESIKTLDVTNLDVSLAAIRKIAAIAPYMPNIKTLWDTISGGQMDFKDFEKQLGYLGNGIDSLSEKLVDVDTDKVTSITSLLPQLVGALNDVASIDTSNVENAQTMLDGFSTFINSIGGMNFDPANIGTIATGLSQLTPSLQSLASLSAVNFEGIATMFTSFSTLSVQGMIEGFTIGFQQLTMMMQMQATNMCLMLQMVFMTQTPMFLMVSTQWGMMLTQGLSSQQAPARNAATAMGTSAVSAILLLAPQFKVAGQNAGQGFVNGILEYVEKAAEAAAQVAQAAVDSMNQTLDAHSPSRKMIQSGEWGGEGFTIGLLNLVSSAKNAGSELATSAMDSVKEAISRARDTLENTSEVQPTIRPVVDLSDVSSKAREIGRTFSANRRFSVGVTAAKVASASYGFASGQNGSSNGAFDGGNYSGVNNFNFTQNNYSPKALSRSEIYRDTNNQFSQLKDAVSSRRRGGK